jgi:hypothetical protein
MWWVSVRRGATRGGEVEETREKKRSGRRRRKAERRDE